MKQQQLVVRRLEAYAARRALPIRSARELTSDPPITLAIATIKIVTEEHVQAIAYGHPDEEPRFTARLDPLGRDATDLVPFARWLIEQMDAALASDRLPRVWIPHEATLETLDVLGHRYERNTQASDDLRRMGAICRVIAREYRHEGQQFLAVASNVLQNHVVTGQSPAEDAHLGSLLAWVSPPPQRDPADLAAERALSPASGVLPNHPGRKDDELVEVLRREWKRAEGPRRDELAGRIQEVLLRAVLDEWQLLAEARSAFWELPLQPGVLDRCLEASTERVLYALGNGTGPSKYPLARIRDMMELEHAQSTLETARLLEDEVLRAEARAKGRALLGTVTVVDQQRAGQKPCVLTIETTQPELRFRRDEAVMSIGGELRARILEITAVEGGTRVRMDVTEGVRKGKDLLRIGRTIQWIKQDGSDRFMQSKLLQGLQTPWMFSPPDPATPPAPPRRMAASGVNLLSVAARHLGGGRT